MTEARRASSLPREGCKQAALWQGTLTGEAGSLLSHKAWSPHAVLSTCHACLAVLLFVWQCLLPTSASALCGFRSFGVFVACVFLSEDENTVISLCGCPKAHWTDSGPCWMGLCQTGLRQTGLCQTGLRQIVLCQTGRRQTISFLVCRTVLLSHGVVVGCGPVLGGVALVQSATLWHGTGIHNSPGGKRR